MSDGAARERAAHCFDRNLVVVAGAGSGKTSLLVERLLCQLVERDLAPDAFAAITFTEKAAAEMRKRLEAALARLAARAAGKLTEAHDEGEEADRAFAWLRGRQSLALPLIAERATARLRALAETEVTTIHGFCARLLRRHPLEAGVDPDFAVDTRGAWEELLDELWERFLAGPDGLEGPRSARFARVLDLLALRELETLARAAAGFAVADESLAQPLPDVRAALGPLLANVIGEIDALGIAPPPAQGPESYLLAARPLLVTLRERGIDAFRAELEIATFASTQGIRGLLESTPTAKKLPEATQLVGEVQKLLRKLRKIDDELLREALALVAPFARDARAEARRRGVLPFDALLVLARDLLASHPEVRRAVAERCRVLFLDEFQDTDPLQYEIVFLIAEPAGAAARPGSLFIVGDPKQAIYRFRGADIAAYEAAVERILGSPGAEQLVLTRNFRAVPELVVPLDALFQDVFAPPSHSDESLRAWVRYDGLEAHRAPAREPRVLRWDIGAAQSADAARELEARVIASWVAREVGAGRFRFGDVALLLRALTDVHQYVRAFHALDVPIWVGRSLESERDPALQQLDALLRALANPADAPAVVGFLRSPLGGVPDAELARHATRARGRWLYTTAPVDSARVPNLARAFETLAGWHARMQREPLARTLAALRDETPLLALHASATDGARRVVDLSAMLDRLVARASAAPERPLRYWVDALEREERRRSAEEPLPDTDAVRVLSIHGAKGLEFDVVILADLARANPRDWEDALRFSREQNALAVRTRAASSSTWIERERIEEEHESAELRRLFYVAATRARERLVVADARRKQGVGRDTFGRLLRDWPVAAEKLDGPFEVASVPRRPVRPRALEALERAEAAAARARATRSTALLRPSAVTGADDEHAQHASDSDDFESERRAARRPVAQAVGTALHELLERWDFRSRERARALLAGAVVRAARRAGADEAEVGAEAGAALESLLAGGLPKALASAEILGRELPLVFRDDEGRGWSGTIDVLYRDPVTRALVVADYKSDKKPDADSRARYRAQLEVYARGVAKLFPGEPKPELELVWLRTGQRERLG
ncbi:MAG TPA: UvrD-helicase domain-containing protein [Myxococcota bacterium]|nr:UvrD-helicase domain-containing protein [Myxococcota bacterium]